MEHSKLRKYLVTYLDKVLNRKVNTVVNDLQLLSTIEDLKREKLLYRILEIR